MNPFNFYAIGLVRFYQIMTKDREHRCLHYPSCTEYMILAWKKYGFLRALHKSIYRWVNCRPESKANIPYEDWP